MMESGLLWAMEEGTWAVTASEQNFD